MKESDQNPIRFHLFKRTNRPGFAGSDSPLTWVCGNCAWSTTVKPTATHCYCRKMKLSVRVTSDRMCWEEPLEMVEMSRQQEITALPYSDKIPL